MTMADITFEEILQAVQKLSPEQKAVLAQSLDGPPLDMGPTREELIAELDALVAAGAFEHVDSLRNAYANPAVANLTDEQLMTDIHEAATEWEQELDEFFGNKD
jgi:phosphoribosylformylglycinamidine (FGAM) synthase-like amidotransferase family enzyme